MVCFLIKTGKSIIFVLCLRDLKLFDSIIRVFKSMKRVAISFFSWLLCLIAVHAQMEDPVKWNIQLVPVEESLYDISFQAKMDAGWHLYDMNLPEGGPVSTSFNFDKSEGVELVGDVTTSSQPVREHDSSFNMELSWFENDVTFVQRIKITDEANMDVAGYVRYMTCNDQNCMPPTEETFSFTGLPGTSGSAQKQVEDIKSTGDEKTNKLPAFADNRWWTPVISQMKALGEKNVSPDTSIGLIFIYGFAGGLLALLTPCVWPMIPMTVSFFLKRTKNRKKSIRDAFSYGLAIIVIYLALGLLITGIFGANALNALSSNAIFNLLFFALLVLFAVSFFGAFEVALPTKWTTKLDSKADATTGLISIFFMAFTLVLVSFSCTGPIIGTLLVQAASMGAVAGPAWGMFGFALALSIPFSLFAIFPSWLQQMPKSGGWLNSVKVVLGFLELALALKFLSVADLAYGWRILDREVFLVLWIVIFALLGLYLLGKLKFAHDTDLPYVSVPRLFMAIISFAFALYMIPGLWGAPLKTISAFAPPLYTQDFNLYEGDVHAAFTDYNAGMEYAARERKPVLVDFFGYGCVNCRKMEAAVWTDAQVKNMIDNDYVLITLMVDDKTPLAQPIVVEENGKERTLRTVGDKWSFLQRYKFQTNTQPYYVLLDNDGMPLAPSYSYDEDIDKYVRFLESGLEKYKK